MIGFSFPQLSASPMHPPFSTTDRASFDAIESWHSKVQAECGSIAMVLVQNKVDRMDEAAMEAREVEYLAKKLKLKLYRTCVKDDLNVTEVFHHLGGEFISHGGEAALGTSGITSIEDVASKPIADRANSKTGASSSAAATDRPEPSHDPQQGFKLAAKKPAV